MSKQIKLTRNQLVEVFELWYRDASKHPDDFIQDPTDVHGELGADTLIEYAESLGYA